MASRIDNYAYLGALLCLWLLHKCAPLERGEWLHGTPLEKLLVFFDLRPHKDIIVDFKRKGNLLHAVVTVI